jgi:hypothetical protein
MSRTLHILITLVVVTASLMAVYHLLSLQFSTGEAYPVYSSLRSDPLGTMALYESLEGLGGISVARNTKDLERVALPENATLLLVGAALGPDRVSLLEHLEGFIVGGGRLVILFRPVENPDIDGLGKGADTDDEDEESELEETENVEEPEADDDSDDTEEIDDSAEDESGSEDMLSVLSPTEDISDRWGFGYGEEGLKRDEKGASLEEAQLMDSESMELPRLLSWQSDLYFEDHEEDWSTVYAVDERAVVIEREWGAGSIVLATDNFYLTNEAMMNSRETDYLLFLLGDPGSVVFDETHLGIAERMGLMQLMIHYRLVPLLVVIFVLTGLFVWKNASSVVPVQDSWRDDDRRVSALGTVEGLARLARRSVSKSDVVSTCWSLFLQAPGQLARLDSEGVKQIERRLAASSRSGIAQEKPMDVYNAVSSIVNERKRHQ